MSGRQEQRALESSFVHESRKQRARRKGRRTRTALDRSHSRSMASATDFPTGLPTPNRHSRSAALERSLSESGGGGGGKPMNQSLHMWLQSHHLQGCEAKLVRIGVTSPRSLVRPHIQTYLHSFSFCSRQSSLSLPLPHCATEDSETTPPR